MPLRPEDLNETDEAILDELAQGRVTPQYVADQLDISRPYASEKLKRFLEHNHVKRLASGLYELENDPRTKENNLSK
ncbi:winged helix-turn-helix transcriptional regulator [Halovenus salina]|uniref:Winged helix-turn-helix transcriptional regulator n=1 Tax=Halovenus salina TaxID=1510225 RepID=A0ABD5WB55_9EURY